MKCYLCIINYLLSPRQFISKIQPVLSEMVLLLFLVIIDIISYRSY